MRKLYLLIFACSLLSCGAPQNLTTDKIRPVKITVAASAGLIDKDFAGMATPSDMVNLAFKVPGQILEIPISEGQNLKKGELIAELDPRDLQLQLSADRSAFEQAQSQFARMDRLLKHQAVSQQDFELARTRLAQAKSTFENSSSLLKDTRLRAPFNSIAERVFVDKFERIQAGQTIVKVVNPVTNRVKFTLPESALGLLAKPSTSFTVEFDNYRGVVFQANLKEYVRTSSDGSGFPVSLSLVGVDAARYLISPGMSCVVKMQSTDPLANAVSLPISAIYAPSSGGNYVWVLGGNDRVERRSILLGELYGSNRVVIDSGVVRGDRVVTAGVYQLRDGEQVKILK